MPTSLENNIRKSLKQYDRKDHTTKWLWMMDYCLKKGLPPAQAEIWKEAEVAFNQTHKASTADSREVDNDKKS